MLATLGVVHQIMLSACVYLFRLLLAKLKPYLIYRYNI